MPARRSILVLAGMLVPAAYARAPQSVLLLERVATPSAAVSAWAGQLNHAGVRSTAAALRGGQEPEFTTPIYAVQETR